MDSFVTIDELKKVTGYMRPGDVEGWLQKYGIRFFRNKDGSPVTTMHQINTALGGRFSPREKIEFGYGQE